jgi:hypothetical protein
MEARAMKTYKLWAVFAPGDNLLLFTVRIKRNEAMEKATAGCMGFRTFQNLDNERARWKHLYKQGYRCRRVTVTA